VHSEVIYTFIGTTDAHKHGQELKVVSQNDWHPKTTVLAMKETSATGTEIFTSTISNVYSFNVNDTMYIKVGIGHLRHDKIKLVKNKTQLAVYFLSI